MNFEEKDKCHIISCGAGWPQEKINEIHGAWGDMKNSVVAMDEELRPDLHRL